MHKYRPDIDGLRAFAVTPVVLYHADVPGFPGGFVGVDIFFVISGYLITSLIADDLRRGEFTILGFYERRVRRILPALFAMLAITALACTFLLTPLAFREFGKNAAAATLFSSNFVLLSAGDYFSEGALYRPLLHTWSLAVEEQYYIVIPIMMMLLARFRQNALAWTAAVCAISFVGAVWMVAHKPSVAFYMAPFRFWELGLGGLLALGAAPRVQSRGLAEAAGALGLLLILAPVFLYDEATAFPGLAAVPPVLGAALLIYAGGCADTFVSRMLKLKPVVFIGLISYSLYLWHWPVIVLYRYWRIEELTAVETALVVIASFALAVLSWRYVEAPFRRRPPHPKAIGRTPLFAAAAASGAVALCYGVGVYAAGGMPGRFPAEVVRLEAAKNARSPRTADCAGYLETWIAPADACVFGEEGPVRIALWGDSHAPALAPAVEEAADRIGVRFKLFARLGCAPVQGLDRLDPQGENHCADYAEQVAQLLRDDSRIDTVILASRLQEHVEGPWRGPGVVREQAAPQWRGPNGRKLAARRVPQAVLDGYADTVAMLRAAGKRVIVVYPVPEIGYSAPSTLARLAAERQDPESFTLPRALYRARMARVAPRLDALPDGPDLVRVRPADFLCSQTSCRLMKNGAPLYFDDNHLSLAGDELMADAIAAALGARNQTPEARLGRARPQRTL